MAVLQADDIADLILMTQRDLGKMRWTELTTDLQEHVAMSNLLRKERVSFGSGYGIQWNIMVQHSGAAKNTGMFEVDSVNVADVMKTANIPWRHCTTNYAIERREIAMNREPARIVELVKLRRADAMISLAALMEDNFWDDPADNDLDPFGIQYWNVRDTTEGFNGGNPTNFSNGAGGLSSTTYDRWRNWTAQYTTVSKTDLVRKWREAATKTNFKPPVPSAENSYNRGNRYGYYTNYDVIGPMEEMLEAQNENLGNDVASKDGEVMFRRIPVTYVPKLDSDSNDTVYGINWGVFYPCFLRGEYMREEGPSKAANQHTVFQTHVDCTLNFKCTDRRRLFRLTL